MMALSWQNATWNNVSKKSLYLAPAERADVIVDFSAYAGKTIIVYNDAPAPVPAFDPRNDYYTGAPDQTAMGGAAPTLAGYGPNTRTIMQIKVAAKAPAQPFNYTKLRAAFEATELGGGGVLPRRRRLARRLESQIPPPSGSGACR